MEWRVIKGNRKRGREEEREMELTKEEVKKVIVKLKDKKAVEVDGIPAEVWKYGGQEVEE